MSETNGSGTTARRRTFNSERQADEESAGGHEHNELPSAAEKRSLNFINIADTEALHDLWNRFTRKGKKNVGVVESLKAIALCSWINLLLVFIPVAWVLHFMHHDPWPPALTFTFCFLAIIPLEKLFDYGGEQMTFYCGKDLGDLIIVSLNNAVEATLAIILLKRCELKLLQSTIVGVVILHLLFIPGVSFMAGGARIAAQDLHPHLTELNHTLLTIGVLTLLLPAAFFAALDRGVVSVAGEAASGLVSETTRHTFLRMSRGLAIILLAVYICSRIFLHDPPGEDNALHLHPLAPEALKHEAHRLANAEPEVNQYVCIAMLAVTIGIMAATAEWLVDSIEFVREEGHIQEEWFGLILLPIVSFSADGAVAVVVFLRYLKSFFSGQPPPPATLAKALSIDLSIQFMLFWMPFIVLLGWWLNRPMTLLFDFFEVALLLGACFLVNYVTADAKTNWAEGFVMVSFYAMIALCAWFYTGQPEVQALVSCEGVLDALAEAASGATEHH